MISEFSFTVEGAEEGMGYLERGVEVQGTEQIEVCGTYTGRRDSPASQSITVWEGSSSVILKILFIYLFCC